MDWKQNFLKDNIYFETDNGILYCGDCLDAMAKSNVWYIPPEHDRSHPAPFPLELPERLLKLYSWQDDVILDPFMGSGTTAVACEKFNRRWIGIDLSEDYCKMAKYRINWQNQRLCVLF